MGTPYSLSHQLGPDSSHWSRVHMAQHWWRSNFQQGTVLQQCIRNVNHMKENNTDVLNVNSIVILLVVGLASNNIKRFFHTWLMYMPH